MTRNDRVHHRNLLWRMFGRHVERSNVFKVSSIWSEWFSLRVCCIHAIIARSPELFKSVMMTPAPLPLPLSYAERGKWKAERLDNGGRGTCRVSRGGSYEMLGKQKPIWMMIRQPSCRTEHERDLWILNYQALCLQQRCWETFPNIHNRSDSISFLQILFYYLRRKVLDQFTGWSWF